MTREAVVTLGQARIAPESRDSSVFQVGPKVDHAHVTLPRPAH
jgi:hypothetical protein